MRTLELHAAVKQVQRSAGRSCVAAAAYRSGEQIKDERTGQIHDYRKKGGVEHSRLYAPDNAPDFARDRAALWNACEIKENRKNSCTARELEIAFPYEFNIMQRREAGDAIAHELMRRYGCAVDIAYHKPSVEGDERNYHAHIMFTTRAFDSKTKDGWSKTKYRDLNNDKIEVAGEKTMRGTHEIKGLRKFAAKEMNRIAAREKMPITTEYQSFAARGIEKIPTKKEGKDVTAMKRKGIQTRRAELNRRIKERNERNFRMLVDIQVQAQRQKIKMLDEKQEGRGFLSAFLGLFTGRNKSDRAQREELKTAIERKTDTIKSQKTERKRQIYRVSNSNVGQKDTLNPHFKPVQERKKPTFVREASQEQTNEKSPAQEGEQPQKTAPQKDLLKTRAVQEKEYLSSLHDRVMDKHNSREKDYQSFIDRHNETMSKPAERADFGREKRGGGSGGSDHD